MDKQCLFALPGLAEHPCPPKVFLGISDITVLLNAISYKTGLITFHGNDVMWGFGRNPTLYDELEFRACFIAGRIGEIPASGERRTIRSGVGQGKLLGGNLNCLLKLAGTTYFPDFTGALLFLEALGITPEGCDYLFQQLKQIGVFDQIRGVLIGYIDGLQNDEQAVMQMEDVLLHVSAEDSFPILKADDFGHNCPDTVLPVGGEMRMDADRQTIEILEKCVKWATGPGFPTSLIGIVCYYTFSRSLVELMVRMTGWNFYW